MRPKGSGYKTQHRILEELRLTPLWFEKIALLINGDRNKASRNLKVLVQKGLVTKKREGHKMIYFVTEKGNHWTDWEGRMIVKRLSEYEEPEDVKREIAEWVRHLPLDFEDLLPGDPRIDELWGEYSEEISLLFESEPSIRKRSPGEIIGWAKELRKAKKEKIHRQTTWGPRERRVGPKIKRRRSFESRE